MPKEHTLRTKAKILLQATAACRRTFILRAPVNVASDGPFSRRNGSANVRRGCGLAAPQLGILRNAITRAQVRKRELRCHNPSCGTRPMVEAAGLLPNGWWRRHGLLIRHVGMEQCSRCTSPGSMQSREHSKSRAHYDEVDLALPMLPETQKF